MERKIENTPFTEIETFDNGENKVCIMRSEWGVNGEIIYIVLEQNPVTKKCVTRFASKKQLEEIMINDYAGLGSKTCDKNVKTSEMN